MRTARVWLGVLLAVVVGYVGGHWAALEKTKDLVGLLNDMSQLNEADRTLRLVKELDAGDVVMVRRRMVAVATSQSCGLDPLPRGPWYVEVRAHLLEAFGLAQFSIAQYRAQVAEYRKSVTDQLRQVRAPESSSPDRNAEICRR
jgi:hypothetical protein